MLASRAFVPLERALERRPAAKKFCWRLPLRKGSKPRHSPATSRRPARPRLSACHWRVSVFASLIFFIVEAIVQLSFSAFAPPFKWSGSVVVVLAFGLQDACRVVLLGMSIYALSMLQRGRDVVNTLSLLFRVLAALLAMEVMELVFKMLEDYAICDGPVAAAARARGEALPEALCFALLDTEDVLMSAASIVALGYVGWIVHSQLRELRHLASVSAGAAPPVSDTSPSNTRPPPQVQFATTVVRG